MFSWDEPSTGGVTLPGSVPVVSEVGVPKRLVMPGGSTPPAASFLAMPGGRSRPRFARPGGFDLHGEVGCVEVTGAVFEMCICNPVRRKLYAADG